jgi:hypothetical protein
MEARSQKEDKAKYPEEEQSCSEDRRSGEHDTRCGYGGQQIRDTGRFRKGGIGE